MSAKGMGITVLVIAVTAGSHARADLILPYDGTANATGSAFSITNNGSGLAIRGLATNTGNVTNYGGYFEAYGTNGRAVAGAVNGSHGWGLHGKATGTDGLGVYGESTHGMGVKGFTTGNNEWVPAVYGRNEGNGDGVYGWSQNRHGAFGVTKSSNAGHAGLYGLNHGAGAGLYAEGGSGGYAAILKGNVQIRSASTGAVVAELGEGLDYAEGFDVSNRDEAEPGTVLVIDTDHPGKLTISRKAYDRKVAGIAAGAKGLSSAVRLGVGQFDCDVALAGRVYCNVDATDAGVEPGDLLTTSVRPGHAMVVTDYTKAQGAILGKAMEKLEKGKKGQILVLVTLQ